MPRRSVARERRVELDEFDALPAALVALDADLCVVHLNRAACRMLGHRPSDLIGTAFAGLAPATNREALDARLRALAAGHRLGTAFEAWLARADGSALRARVAGAPLHRAAGDVVALALEDRTNDAAGDDGSFRALVETAPTAIISTDQHGVVVFVNAAAEKLLGWSAAELVGRPVEVLVPHEARRAHRELRRAYADEPAVRPMGHGSILWAQRKDGTQLPVEICLAPAHTPRGTLFQTVIVDVSERLRAEEQLARHATQQAAIARLGERALEGAGTTELMELAAASVAEGLGVEHVVVLQRDPYRRRLLVRAAVGWPAEVLDEDVPEAGSLAGDALRSDGPVAVEDLAAESHEVEGAGLLAGRGMASCASVAIGGPGSPIGVLSVQTPRRRRFSVDDLHFLKAAANVLADALHRRAADERTRHAALHDPLTALANRTLLLDRVRHWERVAERGAHGLAAVLFLDLDDFKLVNDSLGHEAGDELLRQVADRLRAAVRPGDTVARFGGDEFVVFLEDLESRDAVLSVVGRVQRAFAQPFVLGSRAMSVSTSIGVALSDEAHGADALVRNADAALYRAKAKGRAGYELFDQALQRALVRRVQLAGDLRSAVRRGELAVHYQPVVELHSGRVAGFEALARWPHRAGRVGPAEFIPIAEETGLVVELGAAVLARAAEAAARWAGRLGRDVAPYGVSVNLSPRQLTEAGIAGTVADVLRRSGLPPHLLALEITETALMADVDGALATFAALRELGVRIVLDDFGTGYSSLSHLKRFPIDLLKVDKLFVEGVAHDAGSRAIVSAVLSMAHGFGAQVVAEGVETQAQRAHVTDVGCRYGQGHLFARDLTEGEAEALLMSQFSLPSRSHR